VCISSDKGSDELRRNLKASSLKCSGTGCHASFETVYYQHYPHAPSTTNPRHFNLTCCDDILWILIKSLSGASTLAGSRFEMPCSILTLNTFGGPKHFYSVAADRAVSANSTNFEPRTSARLANKENSAPLFSNIKAPLPSSGAAL